MPEDEELHISQWHLAQDGADLFAFQLLFDLIFQPCRGCVLEKSFAVRAGFIIAAASGGSQGIVAQPGYDPV